MRAFSDTNVLASALGTRGLRADVLRLILREHELVTGEVVLGELRGALGTKVRRARESGDRDSLSSA